MRHNVLNRVVKDGIIDKGISEQITKKVRE